MTSQFLLAENTAAKIRPLLPMAKRAYGSQGPESEARKASEEVNSHILWFVDQNGKIPELAACLEGEISLSGLRRRVRVARGAYAASLDGVDQVVGRVPRPRGSKDETLVNDAVERIRKAREEGGRAYGDAVRAVYDEGVSLKSVADILGVSTYSLWSARRTSW